MTSFSQRIHTLKDQILSLARTILGGRNGRIVNVIFSIVTLAGVGWLLYGQREAILAEAWGFNYTWAAITLGALTVDMALGGWGWHLLVGRLTGYRHLKINIALWWQSNLAKRIPGNVWYVANRILSYEERGVSKLQISVVSGLELVVILLSGIIVTALTIPFWRFSADIVTQISQSWIVLVLGVACLLLIHPKVIGRLFAWISKNEFEIQLTWADSIYWLFAYGLVWLVGGLVLFGLIATVRPIDLEALPQVIGMWATASTLSLAGALTFTSMGIREISLWVLLGTMMPQSIALILVVILRLLWLMAEFVTGIVAFRMQSDVQKR